MEECVGQKTIISLPPPLNESIFSTVRDRKKKMLKYAKRTQFIGLSTPTVGYTAFSAPYHMIYGHHTRRSPVGLRTYRAQA